MFWDIIFTAIPGAFETPFQVAPLDIDTDTFYHSRCELFDKRSVEIKEGKAREIIRNVVLKHRDDQTLCAGVRWDLVEREDMENIVEVSDDVRLFPSYLRLTYGMYSTLVPISCGKFLELSLRNIVPEAAVSRIFSFGTTRRNVANSSKSKVQETNSQRTKRSVELISLTFDTTLITLCATDLD